MGAMAKKKIRVELRKNRTKPPRDPTWTQKIQEPRYQDEAPAHERVRAKGDLSRYRTITHDDGTAAAGDNPAEGMPAADLAECRPGRVIRVHGLQSVVEAEDGTLYRCAVRRLLKSLVTDERNIVTT